MLPHEKLRIVGAYWQKLILVLCLNGLFTAHQRNMDISARIYLIKKLILKIAELSLQNVQRLIYKSLFSVLTVILEFQACIIYHKSNLFAYLYYIFIVFCRFLLAYMFIIEVTICRVMAFVHVLIKGHLLT